MNKKSGFSMVELIIVIAVIAILAGILIPVFTNIIDNANRAEAVQNAKNSYTKYAIDHVPDDAASKGKLDDLIYIQEKNCVVIIKQGSTQDEVYKSQEEALKELCDNPADYKLVATEDAKLFIVTKK